MKCPRCFYHIVVLLCALLFPGAVLTWVWWPLHRYIVSTPALSDAFLEESRRLPSDRVLKELTDRRFVPPRWQSQRQLVSIAEKLLRGDVEIPRLPKTTLRLPFDPEDVGRGTQSWQLENASLLVPEILLDAYKFTGDERFFDTAQAIILGWARYERRVWFPRAFLWNDHAMANRIGVLIKYWRFARLRDDVSLQTRETVLQFVHRTAALCARPENFTVATNHGVMENLALLQTAIAFPHLPGAHRFQRIALARLHDQIGFYLSDEGVVMEHSAGYHSFGLNLLELTFCYLKLLDTPIPLEWKSKYDRAALFYSRLRRPDGSLPMFGDTDGGFDWLPAMRASGTPSEDQLPPAASLRPDQPEALYPVAGYSIWWDGLQSWPDSSKMAQTAIGWSHFPGLGHKHADELSLAFWASGQLWWTCVGYWPYDDPHRPAAEAWQGSDAPHLVEEPANSSRISRLLSSVHSSELAAIDLVREGPGAYRIRRQVVRAAPRIWIVVDSTLGGRLDRTTTTWNLGRGVQLQRGSLPGSYSLRSERTPSTLSVFLSGSEGMTVRELRGIDTPFAGWETVDGVPTPTWAIVTEQPSSGSWSLTSWSLQDGVGGRSITDVPRMVRWDGPDNWQVSIGLPTGMRTLARAGAQISLRSTGPQISETVRILAPAASDEIDSARQLILRSHAAAQERYPKVRDLLDYRLKVTYLILALFFFQELIYWGGRKQGKKLNLIVGAIACAGWLGLWIWLAESYFRV